MEPLPPSIASVSPADDPPRRSTSVQTSAAGGPSTASATAQQRENATKPQWMSTGTRFALIACTCSCLGESDCRERRRPAPTSPQRQQAHHRHPQDPDVLAPSHDALLVARTPQSECQLTVGGRPQHRLSAGLKSSTTRTGGAPRSSNSAERTGSQAVPRAGTEATVAADVEVGTAPSTSSPDHVARGRPAQRRRREPRHGQRERASPFAHAHRTVDRRDTHRRVHRASAVLPSGLSRPGVPTSATATLLSSAGEARLAADHQLDLPPANRTPRLAGPRRRGNPIAMLA